MYCRKCNKHSPDNFVKCAYCGAKLSASDKKTPAAFIKKREIKGKPSLKTMVIISLVFSIVLSVAAVVTAVFTGSKPEKTVKAFASAIQNNDEKLYYSLFDDDIKQYKKENRYFGDEETFDNMVLPLAQSNEFYKKKCGADYKLSYSITSSVELNSEELKAFSECLEGQFSYIKLPDRVELLNVEITAKGELGEYKSIYNDFWCMKIKGKWYNVDKTVYNEYEKLRNSP